MISIHNISATQKSINKKNNQSSKEIEVGEDFTRPVSEEEMHKHALNLRGFVTTST